MLVILSLFFFFNDTATTEIYTLSLHDALPICPRSSGRERAQLLRHRTDPSLRDHLPPRGPRLLEGKDQDRKSTRLNSSHLVISYAVFCLKKKNNIENHQDALNTRSLISHH